ncbi:MAG: nucleotide sugar dehydrogenase [Alphaproteobacteria bacterium]
MAIPVIGYAGMTHLGLNSAAAAAEKGHSVVCFDPDEGCVVALRNGDLLVVESGLAELFARNKERLKITSDASVLAGCDVVYVAPDVPTDDSGASDIAPVTVLTSKVSAAMRSDGVMVILSQVPPGFTRSLRMAPERLFYQVETLIFGRAVERALHPERFIIGCADPSRPLPTPLAAFLDSFGCPVLPMRYESAELAKISINMFLVASVTTSNTLAEVCEKIGADWSEIAPALRLDRRIGAHAYLNPGLGIAGGNLERDLATVVRFGDALGTDVGLVRAFQANSRYRCHWALRRLHETVLSCVPKPRIAVLGLSYKEDTASTKNSPSLALIGSLRPFEIIVFDPVVRANPEWHPRLAQASSALSACEGADVLMVMTPWGEFRGLDVSAVAAALSGRVVIDPYGMLDGAACRAAGLMHHRLGAAD